MVRLRNLALFFLLFFVGCLWSPDIQERTIYPQAPVLDRTRITPPPDAPDQSAVLMTGTTTFSVEGAVSDEDNDPELLSYHWFLDYPVSAGPAIMAGLGGFKTVSINPCSRLYRNILTPQTRHLLELIVTDGVVEYDPLLGRTVKGGYAYVAWWIEVNTLCPEL